MNRLTATLALLILSSAISGAAEPERLIHRWEHEPDLGSTWLIPPNLPTPVLQPARFASPQRAIQLAEARLAIRYARNPALQGQEASLPVLLEQLKTKSDNQAVRVSLAAAAIALSEADQAELLWEQLRHDDATRRLIERALISWKSPLALESWRARASEMAADQTELLLAIEGLGAMGDSTDRMALETVLRADRSPVAIKFVVVRALAQIAPSGLEDLAQEILTADIEHRELLAAELLSTHSTDIAREILQSILQSDSLPAQVVAYAAVADNFPQLARELAPQMLSRPDNNLRLKACEVFDREDDVDSLRQLAAAIADTNLQIRNTVREQLLRKAEQADLRPVVDEVITYQLTSGTHQGIEQSILMAVALAEHDRADQLLPLLQHPRPETAMYAAWGLQELANTPEIAQAIFEFTQPITERLSTGQDVELLHILRQSFLFEALGRNQFQPAAEMLKIYVPKNGHKMGDMARASAIWALGKILQGSQDEDLAQQLAQRMLDENVLDPEDELVRYNATIALGWIGAPSSVDQLQRVAETPPFPLGLASQWSLQQFAGSSSN